MSSDTHPADRLCSTIATWLVDELNSQIGQYPLRELEWDGDEDDDDPCAPLIVKDAEGRRFEVEIDVSVTELTEAVLAERAAFVERMQRLQAAHAARGEEEASRG